MTSMTYMSLRDQLFQLLPDLLPADPVDAVKGTELIQLTRMKLEGDYSDASLRYHFSIMSCDPASPIAKVEKGQGYYRRSAQVPPLAGARELLSLTQGRLDDLGRDSEAVDTALLRIRKFRAVVARNFEAAARFPFTFRFAFQEDSPIENFWKFPEAALVDWQTAAGVEGDFKLNPAELRRKQQLGLSAYQLTGVRLRIVPSHASYREDFFQTLSSCTWANCGELIYAGPIEDEALADSLRHLSQKFGIGVTTFGLTPEALDELPRPANILNAHPRETEALLERIQVHRIATPRVRDHIDWQALNAIRGSGEDFDLLFRWIDRCLDRGQASPFSEA